VCKKGKWRTLMVGYFMKKKCIILLQTEAQGGCYLGCGAFRGKQPNDRWTILQLFFYESRC
jgi:hypothetical protein